MKRISRWIRRKPPATAPSPSKSIDFGTLIPIEEIAFAGSPMPILHSACHAGLVNRIRCLLTSAFFSEATPVLYWPTRHYDHKIHDHSLSEAERVFAPTVIALAQGTRPPASSIFNADWHLLNPHIMKLPGDSRSFCIDALNGDGLKNANMLYLMPDEIFYSFQDLFHRLLRPDYLSKVSNLISVCSQRKYGIIALRYWVDCRRSLNLADLECKPQTTWSEPKELGQYLQAICLDKKWTRTPPSYRAVRIARSHMQDLGIQDIMLTSDRFQQRLFDSNGSIREELARFRPGLERQVAMLYVIANAQVICRSKDSTYTQFPLLLGRKWSAKVIDF